MTCYGLAVPHNARRALTNFWVGLLPSKVTTNNTAVGELRSQTTAERKKPVPGCWFAVCFRSTPGMPATKKAVSNTQSERTEAREEHRWPTAGSIQDAPRLLFPRESPRCNG